MTGKTKAIIAVLLIVILGAAAVVALRSTGDRGAEVRVEAVETRDLVAKVTASGNIRARVQVDVSSDVAGRVATMHVREGDDVEQGDLLLELERTQFEAALARAQASLRQAQAAASQQRANRLRAARDYDRVRTLQQRDSLLISRQQVEDAETNLEVAQANLEAAEFAVEQAQAGVTEAQDRLDNTIFQAPMAGRVTRLNVEEGETVITGTMNNPGSLILSISDLSVVEAVVRVDETDIPLLDLGDRAEVEIDAFPDRTFSGTVTEIGNSAIQAPSQQAGVQQAIDFEVVITLDPSDVALRPDLSATADIITGSADDVVSVPIIAVTLRDREGREAPETDVPGDGGDEPRDVEGVFLVSGGEVAFTPVGLGIVGEEYFEVTSGLSVGDSVVAGPYQAIRQLQSGDRVRPVSSIQTDGES